jgi:1-acyl-sn-glycerol-3-phosphate acyltransferase
MSRDAAPRTADGHRATSRVRRALGRAVLRAGRWTITGDLPQEPKFVAIVAPHTSNWDFVVGVAAMFALEIRVRWLGKHTLFRWPIGWLLRGLGGWPVKRDAPGGVVAEAVAAMRAEPEFILALAPEGTRRHVDEWRTGFHRIAEQAGVPVVPVALDWAHREVSIGKPEPVTGDAAGDIARLRSRFTAGMALRPDRF